MYDKRKEWERDAIVDWPSYKTKKEDVVNCLKLSDASPGGKNKWWIQAIRSWAVNCNETAIGMNKIKQLLSVGPFCVFTPALQMY